LLAAPVLCVALVLCSSCSALYRDAAVRRAARC
jgi:hypothetical protein